MTAIMDRWQRETREFFMGSFSEDFTAEFHRVGRVTPERWALEVNNLRFENEGRAPRETRAHGVLTLTLPDRHGGTVRGVYGFPREATREDHPNIANAMFGHLVDLPEELLQAISETSGVDLVELKSN